MDIERIKKSRLGRLWLSAYVRRVWEHVLTSAQQRQLLAAERLRDGRVLLDKWVVGRDAVPDLEAFGFIEVDWRRFKRLTPLGVEVYLHGRREARKRGGR